MRHRSVAALTIAALLTACGSPTPAPAPTPVATTPSGDTAKVAALSPRLRAGVLLRAIRDAGQDCQQVIDQAQASGGAPAWIATCQDKHRWVVAIAADGDATVIDANDVSRQH